MLYCYKRISALRRHSTGELVWVAPKENKLECSPYVEDGKNSVKHYYAAFERGELTGQELVCYIDSCGQYGVSLFPCGKYHVGKYNILGLWIKEIFAIFPCEDMESLSIFEEINPKNHQEWFLEQLNGENPDIIREYYPNAHYVVTRSYSSDTYPWKRFGKRSYAWVVPLEARNTDKGRRIEWNGDTTLYPTRKEALNALYGEKK